MSGAVERRMFPEASFAVSTNEHGETTMKISFKGTIFSSPGVDSLSKSIYLSIYISSFFSLSLVL